MQLLPEVIFDRAENEYYNFISWESGLLKEPTASAKTISPIII